VDNLKSAVLKRIIGQSPVFNQKYLDFSQHYGFGISACNIRKGNEKGRRHRLILARRTPNVMDSPF
jgi:transposase